MVGMKRLLSWQVEVVMRRVQGTCTSGRPQILFGEVGETLSALPDLSQFWQGVPLMSESIRCPPGGVSLIG